MEAGEGAFWQSSKTLTVFKGEAGGGVEASRIQ